MILQTRNVRRILERFVICQDTLHNLLRLCQLIGAVTSCCSAPWSACVLLGWFHGVPKVLLLKCTDPVNLNWNLFWGKTHNINSGQALLDDLLCNDGRFCSFFLQMRRMLNWLPSLKCAVWDVQDSFPIFWRLKAKTLCYQYRKNQWFIQLLQNPVTPVNIPWT